MLAVSSCVSSMWELNPLTIFLNFSKFISEKLCSWSTLYFNWSRMGNYILINYHICLQTDTDFCILLQNLPNGVLLFTNIARSCLTGGLIQELEEHIGSGQGFQQPQDWTNLETSTGSGLRLHTPGFNEEYWQAGPGACGFVGGHFQDFNVSHFASGEGSSRNDHAETSSEPPSFLERYEIQQTNPG